MPGSSDGQGNYITDNKKGSRLTINSWIKNGDLNDVYRDLYPEKR